MFTVGRLTGCLAECDSHMVLPFGVTQRTLLNPRIPFKAGVQSKPHDAVQVPISPATSQPFPAILKLPQQFRVLPQSAGLPPKPERPVLTKCLGFILYFSSIPSVSLVSQMDPLPLAAEQTHLLKGSVKRSNPHSQKYPHREGLPGTTFHKSHSPRKTSFPNTGLHFMFFQECSRPCKSYEGFSMG